MSDTSFTHASRGPNHFASSFFDSRGEIESYKRLVFDNQYRDLIQQASLPGETSLPWPSVFANNLLVAWEQSLSLRDVPSVSK